MKTKSLFMIATIIFLTITTGCEKEDIDDCQNVIPITIADIDGNIYNTIQIGEQSWMAENLAYDAGNSCWVYDDNSAVYLETYGRLYNWESANEVCPEGWHLPSNADWDVLFNALGGVSLSGGFLKETGTLHWKSPNTDANDSIGFTALPAGFRNFPNGQYQNIFSNATFWSSTEDGTIDAHFYGFNYSYGGVNSGSYNKDGGFSVRCVKNSIEDFD